MNSLPRVRQWLFHLFKTSEILYGVLLMMYDIVNGKTDGIKAFMSGKLKFQGDIILAQQIEKLFGIR
ncbi:MAG TPA: SCP2 sterol-binding domain-containing protein [Desulfobacteraceae bacterium]|nr:SCP2 sterol-binding domain-containing protein [Desulfobacteraceae bacterium]